MVLGKSTLILGGLGVVAFLLLAFLLVGGFSLKDAPPKPVETQTSATITATYVSAQLKQVDKSHAMLLFSYDLENNTATDYHLADVPDNFVMARLRADGSLSQQQDLRLSYPVQVPSKQRVRIGIEQSYAFNWPSSGDPGINDKLRNFVRQQLQNISGFVLFDGTDHWQAELPGGWATLAKNE
jgi:hypothetical protein